ncbi:hypothetical protein [Flammeovirga sp. SubArs3]|uniref:hypothetical protein n=1 Tax=Flammeovirga sp. SubArs3 TaxID=2995316 RepID=UPI00248B7389|nr:hypothetical protein [Flammeovirga sp. SubArs3]
MRVFKQDAEISILNELQEVSNLIISTLKTDTSDPSFIELMNYLSTVQGYYAKVKFHEKIFNEKEEKTIEKQIPVLDSIENNYKKLNDFYSSFIKQAEAIGFEKLNETDMIENSISEEFSELRTFAYSHKINSIGEERF